MISSIYVVMAGMVIMSTINEVEAFRLYFENGQSLNSPNYGSITDLQLYQPGFQNFNLDKSLYFINFHAVEWSVLRPFTVNRICYRLDLEKQEGCDVVARETHRATCHYEVTPSKTKVFLNSPCFLKS